MKPILNTKKATGRRKCSIATVELTPGTGEWLINDLAGLDYMQKNLNLVFLMQAPLAYLELKNDFNLNIHVKGGGLVGQASAIKLAIARALCEYKPAYRAPLKLNGYLTRDARIKERKKYGLKKARKAPQYSKR